jgi:membrane-bound ClpP family serine protease
MVKVLGDTMRAEAEVVIEEGCRVRVKRAAGTHVVVEPESGERTSEAVETGGRS